jgi:hypothetical protein
MNLPIEAAQFVTASTPGDVYVELGFIPDYVVLIHNAGLGTQVYNYWFNSGTGKTFPLLPAGAVVAETGTAQTLAAANAIAEYTGGETIAVAETVNTAGKHVTKQGVAAIAGHVTAPGVKIALGLQTSAGGNNVLIAYRLTAN